MTLAKIPDFVTIPLAKIVVINSWRVGTKPSSTSSQIQRKGFE
jgi:hypothetical protein